MKQWNVQFEVRSSGAIGEFWWNAKAKVEAVDQRKAIEEARKLLGEGHETRGVRCEPVW